MSEQETKDTRYDLQKWMSKHGPSEGEYGHGAFWSQCMFIRDELVTLVRCGLSHVRDRHYRTEGWNLAKVVGSHRSRSIILPVVEMKREDLGLRFIVRNNFCNWKLSVDSARSVVSDLSGLFYESPPREPDYTGNCLAPCYFEGFSASDIFGYRSENPCQWSAEIYGHQTLYTTLFLIMREFGQIKPMLQSTRVEHRAELDASQDNSMEWRS